MSDAPSLQGGCLCGQVRYEVNGAPRDSCTCFCHSCRRASGAPSVAWFTVSAGDHRLLSGEPAHYRSSASVTRTFCPRCGTTLAYQHDDSVGEIDLATATLDTPEAVPPQEEIWLSHKIGWAASDQRLAQSPEARTGH